LIVRFIIINKNINSVSVLDNDGVPGQLESKGLIQQVLQALMSRVKILLSECFDVVPDLETDPNLDIVPNF
jgi:hypothetical protein